MLAYTHACNHTQDAPRNTRSADQSHNQLRPELTRSSRRLEVPPALMRHKMPPAPYRKQTDPHQALPNLPAHALPLLSAAAPHETLPPLL